MRSYPNSNLRLKALGQVWQRINTPAGIPIWDAVVVWNDAPGRTFAEVRALIEELDL